MIVFVFNLIEIAIWRFSSDSRSTGDIYLLCDPINKYLPIRLLIDDVIFDRFYALDFSFSLLSILLMRIWIISNRKGWLGNIYQIRLVIIINDKMTNLSFWGQFIRLFPRRIFHRILWQFFLTLEKFWRLLVEQD